MRIAFISFEFPPETGKGGIGTYIKQNAACLSNNGFEVHVFVGSFSGYRVEWMDGYWVHKIPCTSVMDFRESVVPYFSEQHERFPFDCMESPEIGFNAQELKKKIPALPLIVRFHAPDYLVESLKKYYVPFPAKLRYFLGALRRFRWDLGFWRTYKPAQDPECQFTLMADYLTAPSKSMKQWIVKHWFIDSGKICVIPNPFDPSENFLKLPVLTETNYNRIVFFGRLNVLKGVVNMTFAMKDLLQEFPDWRFRVIGEDGPSPSGKGSMREWMEKELASVMNRVEFFDGMNNADLPAALESCEIVLLPSLFESFSYACVEAMAAGKAVVGSKMGGMADLIKDGYTGLLVDPFKRSDLKKSLRKLIVNKEFRMNLSKAARSSMISFAKDANRNKLTCDFYSAVCSAQQ